MSNAARRPVRRRWLGCGCLALLLFGLVSVGAAAWYFWPVSAAAAAGPLVYLAAPQTGDLFEVNAPLRVTGNAHDARGVTRLELYADGALVAVQTTSLPGGSNPLELDTLWIPLTIGRHVLMTRAYLTPGVFADSDLRFVEVLPLLTSSYTLALDGLQRGDGAPDPSLIDVAAAVGVPAEQLRDANPQLAAGAAASGGSFDVAAPLPPGTVLDIPRTPAPPPGESGGAPASGPEMEPLADAPPLPAGLTASADCADAVLSWNASEGADGYVIYRLDASAPVLVRLAALAADQLTYADTLPALGQWGYQVAAVRAGVEALSPLQRVETPADCLPPAAVLDTRLLSLLSLHTTGRFEGLYCYLSVNGAPYERYPAGDFNTFAPGPDGQTYHLGRDADGHAQFVLGVAADGGPLTLAGECFGRQGALAISLGTFTASHLPADWDGRELHQTVGDGPAGFELGYRLDPNTPEARSTVLAIQLDLDPLPVLDGLSGVYVYGPGTSDNPSILPTPAGPVVEPGDPPLYFQNLPWPTNVQTPRSLDGCRTLPDARSQGRCVLGGLLGGGWPTLTWDWEPNSHYAESDLTGYYIRAAFWRADSVPEIYPWRAVVRRPAGGGPIPRVALIPANIIANLPCGLTYRITVRAIIAGDLLSGPGGIYDLPTRRCPIQARMRVEFQTLTLASAPGFPEMSDVNGDPCFLCVDRQLELRDTNRLNQPGPAFFANGVGLWIWGSGGNVFAGCPAQSFCFLPGEHLLSELQFTAYSQLAPNTYPTRRTGIHNNWVEFAIADYDTLMVGYQFAELDAAGTTSTHGTGCVGRLELPARTVEAWARVREGHTLTAPGDEEGTCQVNVFITGAAYAPP